MLPLSLSLVFYAFVLVFICVCFDLKCFVRVSLSIATPIYIYIPIPIPIAFYMCVSVSVSVSANTYVSYTCILDSSFFSLSSFAFLRIRVFYFFCFLSFVVCLFFIFFWQFRYILSEFYCVFGSLFPLKCVFAMHSKLYLLAHCLISAKIENSAWLWSDTLINIDRKSGGISLIWRRSWNLFICRIFSFYLMCHFFQHIVGFLYTLSIQNLSLSCSVNLCHSLL